MVFFRPARNRRSTVRHQSLLQLEMLEDRQLLSTFTVLNTNDSGAGSLRQAITDANAAGGANQINFNIASSGTQTIQVLSTLPALGSSIALNGTTEPGFSGTPLIVLSGYPGAERGLDLAGNGNTILDLQFVAFGPTPQGQSTVPGGPAISVEGNNNVISGNMMGTDGLAMELTGSDNTIGGTTSAAGNLMSFVTATGQANIFEGDTIDSLVVSQSPGLIIGGTAAGAGNVIAGINISNSSGAMIQGNLIKGLVLTDSPGCTVGGATTAARNVISSGGPIADIVIALSLSPPGTPTHEVIEGNFIGTQADGKSPPSGSSGAGILIDGSDNTIMNNTIAFHSGNQAAGVEVGAGTGNLISQNTMFDNGVTGIQLGPNPYTPNGPNPGTGPNNSQNFPIITSATESGGNTVITGTLNSQANSTYTLEFYAASDRDAGGSVEGRDFLGSQMVITDGSGNAGFTFTGPADPGPFFTATATDAGGDTSEFWQPDRPVPVITSFTLGDINGGGQITGVGGTLTIEGSNFFTTTTAQGNSYNTPSIVYISTTQVQVFVNNAPGYAPVTLTLVNPGPGGGPSNSIMVTLTANEAFVEHVYANLLNRNADISGFEYWGAQLDQGLARSQFVLDIEGSPEYRADEVQSIYQRYLHRAADPSGLQSGVTFLENGGTVEQLSAAIIASPEYFQNRAGSTNLGFLTALYHDALGRALDPSGQSNWLQAFSNGATRYQVGGAIITSVECRQDFVVFWYSTYLHRPADSGGLNQWVTLMGQGATDEFVVAAIIGSQEYFHDVTGV